MPIHFTIDHDKRYVEARTEGPVELKDLETFLDAILVQNALGYRKLFDGRKAVGKYDDHDVMMLGARISAYAALQPRGALALIVATAEAMDLARRFINLGKSDRPAKVFLSEDEARQWLMSQPEA